MTKQMLFALSVLLLLVPSSAVAQTTIVAAEGSPYQRWIDEADVPTVPGAIEVREATLSICEGEPACAGWDRAIYMPPLTPSPEAPQRSDWRLTFYHEMGHEFDMNVLTESDRARFLELVRVPGRPWEYAVPGMDIHETSPNEFFAEAYSECAELGLHMTPWRRFVELPIYLGHQWFGFTRYREMCGLITAAGNRAETESTP